MDPGLEEIPPFWNVVGSQRVEKGPATIVGGGRSGPGCGIARLFVGFKPEKYVYPADFLGVFHLDCHLREIRLAYPIEDVSLREFHGYETTGWRRRGNWRKGCQRRKIKTGNIADQYNWCVEFADDQRGSIARGWRIGAGRDFRGGSRAGGGRAVRGCADLAWFWNQFQGRAGQGEKHYGEEEK